MSKKKKQVPNKAAPVRKVDQLFEMYNSYSQSSTNRILQSIFLVVFAFAFLGLIWMIPFPKIAFLEKHGYDTFLNWASFFIAGMLYYYLRLATTLSYGVLLLIGLFSYFIVQLEYVQYGGGPSVWTICLLLLLVSFVALFIGNRMEKRPAPPRVFFSLLGHGPIWLMHFVFKRLKIPY